MNESLNGRKRIASEALVAATVVGFIVSIGTDRRFHSEKPFEPTYASGIRPRPPNQSDMYLVLVTWLDEMELKQKLWRCHLDDSK